MNIWIISTFWCNEEDGLFFNKSFIFWISGLSFLVCPSGIAESSDQISRSVVSTLCNPMNRSTPGFPVLYHLPEFAQTHVH